MHGCCDDDDDAAIISALGIGGITYNPLSDYPAKQAGSQDSGHQAR